MSENFKTIEKLPLVVGLGFGAGFGMAGRAAEGCGGRGTGV